MSQDLYADDRPKDLAPTRIVSAGVEDALQRFSDPELLAAGKVNVISVEAIQARFGARWNLRSDQVYDFTTRVLERGVGDQGFFLRVSGTDFFIVHPDLGKLAGQTACLRYLREVLNHFLGEDQLAAAGVLQVTRIARGQVQAQQMDVRAEAKNEAPDEAPSAEPPASDAPPPDEEDLTAEPSIDKWTPFVANDGRGLRVSATLEPVLELKAFTRIGFRMIRRVIDMRDDEELSAQQVRTLSTSDILRVDLATVARGIGRLKTDGEQQLSLIVPLSYTSLSSQKGRAEFVTQLKEAGSLVRLGVICEICDIEGVPPSALLAATSLVRPFSLLVVGRLTATTPGGIARLEGSGLQAVSFECPPGIGDAEFVGWATASITAARRVARSVLVYRARSAAQAGVLASLGASHVSITSL